MPDPIRELLARKDTIEHIPENLLIDAHAYVIVARNAYVGVWDAFSHTFRIARFKYSLTPYLFEEYHWDFDPRLGTVKPLRLIEQVPPEIFNNEAVLLSYLCELECLNPLVDGIDTVAQRIESVRRFLQRLEQKNTHVNNKDKTHENI